VKAQWKYEPAARLRAYLLTQRVWSKADEERLLTECQHKVESAAERYLAEAPRSPETLFDHLYAKLPKVYWRQRQELMDEGDA
jgi:2-oxoisovalerate dehydrogenase E1 component alpha subunit